MSTEDDFREFCLRYLDGELDEAGCALLNQRLEESAKMREIFLQICDQEVTFQRHFSPLVSHQINSTPSDFRKIKAAPAGLHQSKPSPWLYKWAWFSSAALMVLSLGLWWSRETNPPPFKLAQQSKDCRWSDGKIFNPARLDQQKEYGLLAGQAQILFSDGTFIDLFAPVSWQISSQSQGTVFEVFSGQIHSHIAPQALGKSFVFLSPHLKATIVGTRIEMSAQKDHTQFAVVEGRVELVHRFQNTLTQYLNSGETCRLGPLGFISSATNASSQTFASVPFHRAVKTSSRSENLTVQISENSERELDLVVQNRSDQPQSQAAYVFFGKPETSTPLLGVSLWIQGQGSQKSYQFRAHSPQLNIGYTWTDHSDQWQEITLRWPDFKKLWPLGEQAEFDGKSLTMFSLDIFDSARLKIRDIKFIVAEASNGP